MKCYDKHLYVCNRDLMIEKIDFFIFEQPSVLCGFAGSSGGWIYPLKWSIHVSPLFALNATFVMFFLPFSLKCVESHVVIFNTQRQSEGSEPVKHCGTKVEWSEYRPTQDFLNFEFVNKFVISKLNGFIVQYQAMDPHLTGYNVPLVELTERSTKYLSSTDIQFVPFYLVEDINHVYIFANSAPLYQVCLSFNTIILSENQHNLMLYDGPGRTSPGLNIGDAVLACEKNIVTGWCLSTACFSYHLGFAIIKGINSSLTISMNTYISKRIDDSCINNKKYLSIEIKHRMNSSFQMWTQCHTSALDIFINKLVLHGASTSYGQVSSACHTGGVYIYTKHSKVGWQQLMNLCSGIHTPFAITSNRWIKGKMVLIIAGFFNEYGKIESASIKTQLSRCFDIHSLECNNTVDVFNDIQNYSHSLKSCHQVSVVVGRSNTEDVYKQCFVNLKSNQTIGPIKYEATYDVVFEKGSELSLYLGRNLYLSFDFLIDFPFNMTRETVKERLLIQSLMKGDIDMVNGFRLVMNLESDNFIPYSFEIITLKYWLFKVCGVSLEHGSPQLIFDFLANMVESEHPNFVLFEDYISPTKNTECFFGISVGKSQNVTVLINPRIEKRLVTSFPNIFATLELSSLFCNLEMVTLSAKNQQNGAIYTVIWSNISKFEVIKWTTWIATDGIKLELVKGPDSFICDSVGLSIYASTHPTIIKPVPFQTR